MPFEHVVANDAQFSRRFVETWPLVGNQRLKMFEPRAAIIIDAEKRGGLLPSAAEKTASRTKRLKACGNFREQMIPRRTFWNAPNEVQFFAMPISGSRENVFCRIARLANFQVRLGHVRMAFRVRAI
jgi:hypothetical protein